MSAEGSSTWTGTRTWPRRSLALNQFTRYRFSACGESGSIAARDCRTASGAREGSAISSKVGRRTLRSRARATARRRPAASSTWVGKSNGFILGLVAARRTASSRAWLRAYLDGSTFRAGLPAGGRMTDRKSNRTSGSISGSGTVVNRRCRQRRVGQRYEHRKEKVKRGRSNPTSLLEECPLKVDSTGRTTAVQGKLFAGCAHRQPSRDAGRALSRGPVCRGFRGAVAAASMVVRLLDYLEHPLDVAERYLLVKQVGHRVHEVDRRITALQRLGQAPRSSLSRWTP